MKKYIDLYEQNKKLDDMYVTLYGNDELIFRKNILEFLVELGEFANETKCFKYWSKKGISLDALEEFADCITMCLYFCNVFDVDLNEIKYVMHKEDVISQFINIYDKVTDIKANCNKNYIMDILVRLLNIGYLFNFSDEEIINSCFTKINKNIERINSNTY